MKVYAGGKSFEGFMVSLNSVMNFSLSVKESGVEIHCVNFTLRKKGLYEVESGKERRKTS